MGIRQDIEDQLLSGVLEETLMNMEYNEGSVRTVALELEKAGRRQRPKDSDGKLAFLKGLDEIGKAEHKRSNVGVRSYSLKNYAGEYRSPDGRRHKRRANGKRPRPADDACEWCGIVPERLGYHHWDDADFSKGLYLGNRQCHDIAEFCEENFGMITEYAEKYLKLKADLDKLFADSFTRNLAWKDWDDEWDRIKAPLDTQSQEHQRYFMRRYYITGHVDGKRTYLKPEHKRPHPTGIELLGPCELCGRPKHLEYHHWDDEELSKGLWFCFRCHTFVGAYDRKPNPNVEQEYLELKRQVEDGSFSPPSTPTTAPDKLHALRPQLTGGEK